MYIGTWIIGIGIYVCSYILVNNDDEVYDLCTFPCMWSTLYLRVLKLATKINVTVTLELFSVATMIKISLTEVDAKDPAHVLQLF